MVVKLKFPLLRKFPVFESSVIPYGSKTFTLTRLLPCLFESSVISYGSKIELAHAINVKLAKKFNWKYRRGKV